MSTVSDFKEMLVKATTNIIEGDPYTETDATISLIKIKVQKRN